MAAELAGSFAIQPRTGAPQSVTMFYLNGFPRCGAILPERSSPSLPLLLKKHSGTPETQGCSMELSPRCFFRRPNRTRAAVWGSDSGPRDCSRAPRQRGRIGGVSLCLADALERLKEDKEVFAFLEECAAMPGQWSRPGSRQGSTGCSMTWTRRILRLPCPGGPARG